MEIICGNSNQILEQELDDVNVDMCEVDAASCGGGN